MLVDHLGQTDVAVLDAALSGEVRDQRAEAPESAPPAADRSRAARGTTAGIVLGAALWAAILIPMIRT
ncbi:MAG TPA: hypothetical protein VKT49_21905 [Bryobacteraceae bacterium]|nr:hypothetical protein [Bryobacteraceae bacterium]